MTVGVGDQWERSKHLLSFQPSRSFKKQSKDHEIIT